MQVLCETLGVVPVLVGPLQALISILPGLLLTAALGIIALFKPSGVLALSKILWRLRNPIVLVVAVVATVIYFSDQEGLQNNQLTTVTENGADHPLFRGGLGRRGVLPNADVPGIGGEVWTYNAGAAFLSSPTLVGNRIYATTAELSTMTRGSGSIVCLDADSGAQVWSIAPNAYRPTFSSPSIAGKYLVVGEGLHYTKDARVVCLDISGDEPKILWTYRTKSHVESTPCIFKDRVIVGAGDDGYYCFSLEPNADKSANILWHKTGANYPDAESSPVVYEETVYVGLGVGGDAILALDIHTGDERWRVNTPYPVFSPPSINKGRVIVGMGNGNFAQTAEVARDIQLKRLKESGGSEAELRAASERLAPGGAIWSINTQDPSDRWSINLPRTVLGAVAADGDDLFAIDRSGTAYVINAADGAVKTKRAIGSAVVASPILTDNEIFICTEQGNIVVFNRQLEQLWRHNLGNGGMFLSSPCAGRGRLFVGTEIHGLKCIGHEAIKTKPIWAGHQGGAGVGGHVVPLNLPEKAELQWRYPPRQVSDLRITAPAALGDTYVYVPFASGPRPGLACLKPSATTSGKALWFLDIPGGVNLSPAVDAELLVFSSGGIDAALHVYDAKLGTALWQKSLKDGASGHVVMTNNEIAAVTASDQLTVYERSGQERWLIQSEGIKFAPLIIKELIFIAGNRSLICCDRLSGVELWRSQMNAAISTPPVLKGASIFVGTTKGVQAINVLDGAVRWVAGEPVYGDLLPIGEAILSCHASGLQSHLRENGALLHTADLHGVKSTLRWGKRALVIHDLGISAWSPFSNTLELWFEAKWVGALTSAPVASAEALYIGSDKLGFISLGVRQ